MTRWEHPSRHGAEMRAGRRAKSAKLTIEKVREIRASTERGKDLAERFGVSQALISQVRHREVWRDIERSQGRA